MGTVFHAVVIQGDIDYKMPFSGKIENLDSGSSFSSSDIAQHDITNVSKGNAIIYVRTNASLMISQSN